MKSPEPLTPDLATQVDRLLSYEQIRQLVYRYSVAVDARDVATVAGLFDDDSEFSPGQRGPAAAQAFFEQQLATYPVTILNVGNHLIDFDDADHAHGVVYCRAELESGDEWIVQMIMYRDRYRRAAGVWRFVSRQHLLFYGADMLTRPNGLPRAERPELTTGRGSAPSIWPTFGEFWQRHAAPATAHGEPQ